eukprot:2118238-Amphidinium_carterae.1
MARALASAQTGWLDTSGLKLLSCLVAGLNKGGLGLNLCSKGKYDIIGHALARRKEPMPGCVRSSFRQVGRTVVKTADAPRPKCHEVTLIDGQDAAYGLAALPAVGVSDYLRERPVGSAVAVTDRGWQGFVAWFGFSEFSDSRFVRTLK